MHKHIYTQLHIDMTVVFNYILASLLNIWAKIFQSKKWERLMKPSNNRLTNLSNSCEYCGLHECGA